MATSLIPKFLKIKIPHSKTYIDVPLYPNFYLLTSLRRYFDLSLKRLFFRKFNEFLNMFS